MLTKTKVFPGILILMITIIACNKEINNPFDPDCSKEIWTPSDFKVAQSDHSLNLSWKQENTNISGFKIERKVGSQDWSNVASPGKTAISWSDNNLTGGKIHQYRLYAYAGDNQSNTVTAQATPLFTSTVVTNTPSGLTCTNVNLGGIVTADGGDAVTEKGVVYSTAPDPTTSDTKVAAGNGMGSFSTPVTGLPLNTTFYVKAYATNSSGTSYGEQKSFKTPATATLTTSTATAETAVSAILGGNITNDGNATITARGVVYAKTSNPTISDTKIAMGSGKGAFSQTVSGLTCATTYYARAYATNCAGTAYGSQITFATEDCAAKINFFVSNSKVSTTTWSRLLTVTLSSTINGTGLKGIPLTPSFGFYISEDDVFSSRTDKLLYEEKASLSALNPSDNISTKITVPTTTTSGIYFILFIADNTGDFDESNEKDNTEAIKISIK